MSYLLPGRAGRSEAADPAAEMPRPKSRVEDTYREILGLITDGALGEGDRLPSEADMAARFGVSRPVVRQALTRLQEGGVVDVRWGAGSYVRGTASPARNEPSFGPIRGLEEVRSTYELRIGLESEAAGLAAERASAASRHAIRAALGRLEGVLELAPEARDSDMQFHLAVAAAAGNALFERMMRSMEQSVKFSMGLSRSLSLTHPEARLLVVQSEHVAIFAAIEAGDAARARAAMRAHLANACRRIFQGPGAA